MESAPLGVSEGPDGARKTTAGSLWLDDILNLVRERLMTVMKLLNK